MRMISLRFRPSVSLHRLLSSSGPPDRLVQYPVRGTRGAVAGGSDYATDAGMRMYYTGGNAVDAGVATIFSAATTEYSHVGWGGRLPY